MLILLYSLLTVDTKNTVSYGKSKPLINYWILLRRGIMGLFPKREYWNTYRQSLKVAVCFALFFYTTCKRVCVLFWWYLICYIIFFQLFFIYSFIAFSFRPIVSIKYPLAQMFLLPYLYFKSACLSPLLTL